MTMKPRSKRRERIVAGLVLMLAAAASLRAQASVTETPAAELLVPRPDLSALEPSAREKIEKVQSRLARVIAAGDPETRELQEGFGFLGQLFHAFELLDSAVECYETARSFGPEDPRWSYYLGLARTSRGDLEGAVREYRRALESAPEDTATLIRLGNVLLDLGRGREARDLFRRASALDAGNAAVHFGLGRIASLSGQHQEAVDHLQATLELQPEASEVHYPLALAYRALGDLEKARSHLERRGETRVSFPDPLASALTKIRKLSALEVVADLAGEQGEFSETDFLGFVLSQFGGFPGAADQLERVMRSLAVGEGEGDRQQRARLEYAIGALFVSEGRDLDAIPHFERAVEGDPTLRDALLKLGNARARSGQFEQAAAAYDRALELRSADPAVLLKRATALANLGLHEAALNDLERATALDPGELEPWKALAEVRERQGDYEGAIAALQSALEIERDPQGVATLHLALADLHLQQGKYDRAAAEYLTILRTDETHVPALSRLAALLGQLGKYRPAAEVYARWTAQEPDNVQARIGGATALILAGEHRAARERLEEALAAAPASLDIKDLLSRHLAACPDPAVRDGERALELALELYQEVPTLESVETLAMAYAEAGRLEEAISWQKRLLEEGGDGVDEARRERWRANLALYESGRPCCAAGAAGPGASSQDESRSEVGPRTPSF